MAKSPSIILRERDDSAYAVTSADTVLAVVGYASKGPIDTPTLVTSRTEFEETFGPAPTTAPWSSLAVQKAFQQGNQVLFYRVADSNAAAAEYVILNDVTAAGGYQEFSPTTSIASGSFTASEVYDFKVQIDSGTVRDVYISSPASGDWSLSSIATAINTQLTSATSGFQEFSAATAPSISSNATEYRIQASVDSTNLAVTGAASTEFSIFLNPGASLSNIATALEAAFVAGTRGYDWYDGSGLGVATAGASTVQNLAAATTYNISVNVDTAGAQNISITTGASAPTWNELAALLEAAINAAFGAESVTVRVKDTEGAFVVQSQTEGATSDVVLAQGTGTDLFDTIEGVAASYEGGLPGSDGTAATAFTVTVDSNTGRVRVTSDTTGTSSTVALTAPTVFAGDSLITLLTSVNVVNEGEALVAATAAVNATSGQVRITADSTGTSSTVAITEGTGTDNAHFVALAAVDSAVAGVDAVLAETTDNVLFRAKQKGSDTNNISIVKATTTNPVTGADIYTIEVYYNSNLKETFSNVSLDSDDTTFFVTVMNADEDNGGSSWVEVEYEDNVVDTTIVFPDGTYTLGSGSDVWQSGDNLGDYDYRAGNDGIPSSGGASLFVAALGTSGSLANDELYNYHLLVTPDNGAEETQDAAIALAEYRKDFLYIADPPYGLTYLEVVDWHNGTGSHGRGSTINSSYAATYWPWLKAYNTAAGEYVWSPPSVFMAAKMVEIDRRFGPWYAVAGDTRGKISGASDIETSPSFAQREVLYGDLNAVNPIVNFVSKGVEVYGQKTLLRETTALNRVNVRRMVIYVKKLIKTAMEGIVFEPHNADSWARATNLINSILEPVRQQNGLDDYRVTIDSSTNTADLIAQGIMKGVIQLVPVGTIEIIDLTISILSPGATIS